MYRQQRVYNKYQRIGKSKLFFYNYSFFHTESNQSNITTKLSRTCLPKIDKKTHQKKWSTKKLYSSIGLVFCCFGLLGNLELNLRFCTFIFHKLSRPSPPHQVINREWMTSLTVKLGKVKVGYYSSLQASPLFLPEKETNTILEVFTQIAFKTGFSESNAWGNSTRLI